MSILINKNIKNILKKKLNLSDKKIQSSDFLEDDILDSFNIIILITEIEKKYKLKINQDKFNIKNFSNLKSIVQFVKTKLK
tara:strand:- start:615 stop:857 length:243 start_codon:yes stop_codon:yes gene_type:complete